MASPNDMLHNKILSLPKSDFPSLQSSESGGKSPPLSKEGEDGHQMKNDNYDDDIADKAPLLLLSMPKALDLKDLSSSNFFISDNNKCRLINESKGITYDLIKVESSNAYVMFPPPSTSSTETNEHSSAKEPPCKRVKTGKTNDENSNDKSTIAGRLLREKNTFFMECEPPTNSNLYQLVHEYLNEHCIYPSSSTCTDEEIGKSISELSEMFLFSQKEILDVLEKMCAFPIHVPSSNQHIVKYGILSEEVERDTWNVILSVLAEWDGGEDYANKGVNVKEMVKIIMKDDDNMEEGIVSYCIKKCQVDGEMDNEVVKLDPNYIAKKLAHQLFNSQIAPWKQSQFLSEWHRLMPGVGKDYEPTVDLLSGIAISVSSISPIHRQDNGNNDDDDGDEGGNNRLYWKYFPKESLPTSDDEKKFKIMFQEKEKWKMEELKPYFDDRLDALLLKYTRRVEDNCFVRKQ